MVFEHMVLILAGKEVRRVNKVGVSVVQHVQQEIFYDVTESRTYAKGKLAWHVNFQPS